MSHGKVYILLIACIAILSCSPRAVQEAREFVAQADSLRAEGQMYADSARLAQTYETLDAIPFPFREGLGLGSLYAHACYHYGRLLREKDNPVEAMQVFINATHSHTHDYHILGRVYNNIGDLCHRAGEFPLSYDMFERSAQMYLKNGDTLLYCYALNDMAFELAMQTKKEEALSIIQSADCLCNNISLKVKLLETKAEMYLKCLHYDSAICCVNQVSAEYQEATMLLIKAQAYDNIGRKDSALLYANKIMSSSYATNQDKFNALYIVTHNDSTLSAEEISTLTSQREDIRYYEYEPRQEKLTSAIQLLEQELARKPDLRWLFSIVALVLFTASTLILYYIWRKRKQHRQIVLDLKEKEETRDQLSKTINDLSDLQNNQHQLLINDIEETCFSLKQSKDLYAELSWGNYEKMCAIINRRIYGVASKLQSLSLSEKEVRLCILILLRVETKQMVDMIPYAHSGLGKFKYTTARKLGTTTANLRTFILNLAI